MKRRLLLGAVALLVALVAAAIVVRPRLVGAAHLGLWPPLRLERVGIRRGTGFEARIPDVWVFFCLRGPGLLGRLSVGLPAGMEVSAPRGTSLRIGPTSWRFGRTDDAIVVRRTGDGAGFLLRRTQRAVRIEAEQDAVGSWLELQHDRRPLVDAGILTGHVEIRQDEGRGVVDVELDVRDARMASLETMDGEAPHAWGGRFSAGVGLAGAWDRASGSFSVTTGRLRSDVVEAQANFSATGMGSGRAEVRLSAELKGLAFDRLLEVTGVELPVTTNGNGRADVTLLVEGRQDAVESARIDARFAFIPPERLPEALLALRRSFRHTVKPNGAERDVLVSPDSRDFVAYADVPPLFIRTLLLGEDSGFFSHPGVDLGEIPKALAAGLERGGEARGASTITQQLAKNLFLSRERRVSRKLKELSLSLLLEACLSKARILEIYLNVIEWGPGVYGLRPASRHYFGKEPGSLTPAEGAFLVAMIPGPIKYQRSIAKGEISEGFRPLVENLLGKLLAVGAIDEREHEGALAARLRFQNRPLEMPGGAPPESDEELPGESSDQGN
jgi:hypothetical protein